jgi:hypothetical protein
MTTALVWPSASTIASIQALYAAPVGAPPPE